MKLNMKPVVGKILVTAAVDPETRARYSSLTTGQSVNVLLKAKFLQETSSVHQRRVSAHFFTSTELLGSFERSVCSVCCS